MVGEWVVTGCVHNNIELAALSDCTSAYCLLYVSRDVIS